MTNIDVVSSRTASSFAQRFPDRGALRQRSVLSGRSFREISVPRIYRVLMHSRARYFASFGARYLRSIGDKARDT